MISLFKGNSKILIGIGVVLTGTITLSCKWWQNNIEAMGMMRIHKFSHNFVQVLFMFLAELTCLIIYIGKFWFDKRAGKQSNEVKFNPLLFLPPAFLDLLSSSIQFGASRLTEEENFSMIEGTIVTFTAILSIAFLNCKLGLHKWIGVLIITFDGLFIVGIADYLTARNSKLDVNGFISGDLFIIICMILRAIQVVYEEILMNKYDISPLKAIGIEGLFGTIMIGICLIGFYHIKGGLWFHRNPGERFEDALDAFTQIGNELALQGAFFFYFFFAIIHNYLLMVVTKYYTGLTRVVTDTIRSIPVWVLALVCGWQRFHYLQIVGYLLFIFGVLVYFKITIVPLVKKYIKKRRKISIFTTTISYNSDNSLKTVI